MKLPLSAVLRMYDCTCNVVEYGDIEDPITHITTQGEVIKYEAVPCKLSYSNADVVGEDTSQTQIVKLFILDTYDIKSGSKIIVTKDGKVSEWKNSSLPSHYAPQQEITLKVFDGWA